MASQLSHPHYTIACEGSRWTVNLSGGFDMACHGEMATLANALIAPGVSEVDIDLTHVSFIDTSGYNGICRAAAVIESSGVEVHMVNPSPAIARLSRALQLVGA